ncbi:uL15 family ribosomal protein [Candidatus Woesearchaeota archaeon]|nr:uL15 family ribosomal protein [Candidatus Woesearchaeota archaeon]
MVVHKRRKVQRQRGSRTHGWGRLHRGSGNKGGAGNAGSGKKADAKKPSFRFRVFGKHGFIPHNHQAFEHTINLKDVEMHMSQWIAGKHATGTNTTATIDLTKLGYTKLLSEGRVTSKLTITIASASKRAVEKVKAAGGTVTVGA